MEKEQEVLENNIDKTIDTAAGTIRKPRTIFSYENLFMENYFEPTFGSTIYHSIINGFCNVIQWEGLPDEISSENLERFITTAGRIKIIKVGTKYFPVHITPNKWNHYGDVIESWIVEPYLGKLNGKKTEIFDNVEIKNNGLGNSILRSIYPYIDAIDEAFFNLDINAKVIAGKLYYLAPETNTEAMNKALEVSLNKWISDGKPLKVFNKSLLSQKEAPINTLDVNDTTDSYIKTIIFNIQQLMNVLGIPNNSAEGKKERMITSEVSIQNILQASIIDNMLLVRKTAAKMLNDKFGWNVTVSVKEHLELDNEKEKEIKEGDKDE